MASATDFTQRRRRGEVLVVSRAPKIINEPTFKPLPTPPPRNSSISKILPIRPPRRDIEEKRLHAIARLKLAVEAEENSKSNENTVSEERNSYKRLSVAPVFRNSWKDE